MPLRHCFLVALLIFLFDGCIDNSDYDIDGLTANPSMVLPLVFGDLQIHDLVDDEDTTNIKIYPDGLVYLAYEQQLKSQGVRELFSVPDKALNRSFVLPPVTLPATTKDFRTDSIIQVIDFDLSPEQLNEIALKSGSITYSTSIIPSSSRLDYEIGLYFPDFKSSTSGQAMSRVVSGSGEISLADHTLFLDKNKFDMKLVLILKKHTSPVVIAPGSSVNIRLDFVELDFDYIKGFFGTQSVSLPADVVSVGAFETAFNGATISLAQPKMSLTTINDNGVPCRVDFKQLEARKQGATPLPVTLNPSNPVSIAYPTVLGTSATSTVAVVNTKQLLDFTPSEFYYQADATINYGVTSGDNFLADTSKLRVRMNVEIPLYGSASGIVLRDTINLDLSDVDESQINSASLKLKLINELPLGGNIQFYLADDNYKVIDALLETSQTDVIKASTVNASGELQTPGIYDSAIELAEEKLAKIFDAQYIIVVANMSTTKNADGSYPNVKFKSAYTLNVDAGIKANLKLNVKL